MSTGARLLGDPDPAAPARAVFLAERDAERSDRLFAEWVAHPERGAKIRTVIRSGRLPTSHPDYAGPVLPRQLPQSWASIEALADLDRGAIPSPVPEHTQRIRRDAMAGHLMAERQFREHATAETGMGVSPEEFERAQIDRDQVRRQSHELASRLESVGKTGYRDTDVLLARWHVHSRALREIPQFRRICLLPYVAAMVRAPKLAALEYFLERHPFCRFWTFTTGARCTIDELRDRVRWLHRQLSRLNHWLRARWGVEMVFRSTEFGSLEINEHGDRRGDAGSVEFGPNGEPLFHVHAHVVIRSLRGFMAPHRWRKMVHEVHAQWVDPTGRPLHWDAGKAIRNARECCKYVTKPGDMLRLSAVDLGRLHEAIFRLHLVQPMGSLAEEIRARRDAPCRKTLRRYRTREGFVWREVFDQNAHARQDEADREAENEFRRLRRIDEMDAAIERTPVLAPGERIAPRDTRRDDGAICRVMARLSPSVGPLGVKEPTVMVMFRGRFDAAKIEAHPLVSRLWASTVDAWEAGLSLRVHTVTPTVQEPEPFRCVAELPERRRPPSEPIFQPISA